MKIAEVFVTNSVTLEGLYHELIKSMLDRVLPNIYL